MKPFSRFAKLAALLLFCIAFFSCTGNHYHDGTYTASLIIYDVTMKINGNKVEVNNSVAGESSFTCTQYPDRIEYEENNGTTRILRADKNGNLIISDDFVFTKVGNDATENKPKRNDKKKATWW